MTYSVSFTFSCYTQTYIPKLTAARLLTAPRAKTCRWHVFALGDRRNREYRERLATETTMFQGERVFGRLRLRFQRAAVRRRAAEISSQRILVRQKAFTHAFNVFSTVIFPIAETESSGVLSDRDDLARREKVVRGVALKCTYK